MAELRRWIERYRTPLGVLIVLALIGLGFAALEHLTQEVRFADVRAAMHALSPHRIVLALLATAGSYLALTFYDLLALRVIGRRCHGAPPRSPPSPAIRSATISASRC